ncbi:MAG: BREX-2 system phosphatase PglZ [Blastocatellia bacterium]|nr:BREX-2 system phosphatase PglZ [Blastocatellia bacterium]
MNPPPAPFSALGLHIRMLARQILQKRPQAPVIGIHTTGTWAEAERESLDGWAFRFVQCDSVLHIRETLVSHREPETTLVILTKLDESDLGLDVLAHLTRQRLFRIKPWSMVETLFGAHRSAPVLVKMPWMAEFLLHNKPPEGYHPEPNGVLTEETVWTHFLTRLGFSNAQPDLRDTLEWTLTESNLTAYLELPSEQQGAVRAWISRLADTDVEWVFRCIEAGFGADAVALGLVFQTLLQAGAKVACQDALIRLERFVGNLTLPKQAGTAWGKAAGEVVEKLYRKEQRKRLTLVLNRFDEILKEVQAEAAAPYSRYSLLGFERLFEHIGSELANVVQKAAGASLTVAKQLLEQVQAHRESHLATERIERVRMALRLCQWLAQVPRRTFSQLDAAAETYVQESGWVDWARTKLAQGDTASAGLNQVYGVILEQVSQFREDENQQFGTHLRDWLNAGCPEQNILPIENVIAELVIPLAKTNPVLLIVLDGMSLAVWLELLEDVKRHGWTEVGAEAGLKPTLAALPTVTESSRVSLLCGKLNQGLKHERKGFQEHPGLLALTGQTNGPTLFLKGDLTDPISGGLKSVVSDTIRNDKKRVVGMVINAIDDHLSGGSQLIAPWNLHHIPVLEKVLGLAAETGRLVIITSDHGHVLERNSTLHKFEPYQRARIDNEAPLPGELRLAGPRVRGMAGNRMIAPWTESIRYVSKQYGYHGGITPQECLVPLAVLVPKSAKAPKGWKGQTTVAPGWWEVKADVPPVKSEKPASNSSPNERPLFRLLEARVD